MKVNFYHYLIAFYLTLNTLIPTYGAEPIEFFVDPSHPCSVSIHQSQLTSHKDIDLFALALQIPPEVKDPTLKDKYYVDLFDFSIDTTYQIFSEDSLKFITFKFKMSPSEDISATTIHLTEHKLLSHLLLNFYENLSFTILRRSWKHPIQHRQMKASTDPDSFLQIEQDIHYATVLKNICNDTGVNLSVLANLDILEPERLIRSLEYITNKEGESCFDQLMIRERKLSLDNDLTKALLEDKKNYEFSIAYRNPRNKGLTFISVKIFEDPQIVEKTFPNFQSTIGDFILTNFYNMISYKIREILLDINRKIVLGKQYMSHPIFPYMV